MNAADKILVWIVLIAVVVAVVSSGQTDTLISSISGVMEALIGVVTAPQNRAGK